MYTLFHSSHELLLLRDSDPRCEKLRERVESGDGRLHDDRWSPSFARLAMFRVLHGYGGNFWRCVVPHFLFGFLSLASLGLSLASVVDLFFLSSWRFDKGSLCTTRSGDGGGSTVVGDGGHVRFPLVGFENWMREASLGCFVMASVSGLAALALAMGGGAGAAARRVRSLVVRHALQLFFVTRRQMTVLIALGMCASVVMGGCGSLFPRTLVEVLVVPVADLASEATPSRWFVRCLFLGSILRHVEAWAQIRLYAASCERREARESLPTEVLGDVARSMYMLSTIALAGLYLLRLRRPRVPFVQVPRQIFPPRPKQQRRAFAPYVVAYGPYGITVPDAEARAAGDESETAASETELGVSGIVLPPVRERTTVSDIVDPLDGHLHDFGVSGNSRPSNRRDSVLSLPALCEDLDGAPTVHTAWETVPEVDEEGDVDDDGDLGNDDDVAAAENKSRSASTGLFSLSGSWTVVRPHSERLDAIFAVGLWVAVAMYLIQNILHLAALFGTPSAESRCFAETPTAIERGFRPAVIASQVSIVVSLSACFTQFSITVRRPCRTIAMFVLRWLCSHQIVLYSFALYAAAAAAAGKPFHVPYAIGMILFPLCDLALLHPNVHRRRHDDQHRNQHRNQQRTSTAVGGRGDGGDDSPPPVRDGDDDDTQRSRWCLPCPVAATVSEGGRFLFASISLLMTVTYAEHNYLDANRCASDPDSSMGQFVASSLSLAANSSLVLSALRLSLVKVRNGALSMMGFVLEPRRECENDWVRGS